MHHKKWEEKLEREFLWKTVTFESPVDTGGYRKPEAFKGKKFAQEGPRKTQSAHLLLMSILSANRK